MDKEKNRPCFEKRVGSIRLVIFENVSENGKPWHNVSIMRSYRSGTEWKDTATFNGEGRPLPKSHGRFSPGWIDGKTTRAATGTTKRTARSEGSTIGTAQALLLEPCHFKDEHNERRKEV